MEVEIGRGKKARRAYGFDDIAIVPSRRTRDPDDIDITWKLGDYRFELPLLASAMDGVTSPATAGIVFDGDEGRLSEKAFLQDFAGDLPEAKARVLYAVQQPFQKVLLAGKTTQAAWRMKPSYYAVSTEDRTINPDLERFMAKRMGAKTIEVKASHLSLISHPDEITRLILEAAGQQA